MRCANDCIDFLNDVSLIPLVFKYDGVEHSGLREGFSGASISKTEYCDKVEYEIIAKHLESGATFKVYLVHWQEREAFSLRAEIFAARRTKVFSDVCWRYTLNVSDAYLCGNYGDCLTEQKVGYAPFCFKLSDGDVCQKNTTGRPTHGYFPYYRISCEDGGAFVVLSWQGRWFAHFSQNRDKVIFNGGQDGLASYLEEGETLRVPLMLVLDYQADPINTWRRFYIDCLMPRPGGRLVPPLVSASNATCADLSQQLLQGLKSWYDGHGIDYDFWWCDAGWCADGTSDKNPTGLWLYGANFEVNRDAFPDGLAWLGKELKGQDRQLLMWFEAEVVRTPDDKMEEFFAHNKGFKREWILGRGGKEWNGMKLCWRLINLGEPEAVSWIEQRIFTVMDQAGANIFRIDFNIPPAEFWDKHDEETGRRGMTENKYCQGYLRLIKDISERYGSVMDSCAEGGGRNDLETMMYMLPLHYSDFLDNCGNNADGFIFMQTNLWQWFPYIRNKINGDALKDKYLARSKYTQQLGLGNPLHALASISADALKEEIALWRRVSQYCYGDYYVLIEAKTDDSPKAFEFYCPQKGEGVVMLFAPKAEKIILELCGVISPSVTDADGKSFVINGNRLRFDASDREARIFFIKENTSNH